VNKAKKLVKIQRERLIGMLFGTPILMPLFWYFYIRADWVWFHVYQRFFAVNRATETQRGQIWGILFGTPILMVFLWYCGVIVEQDHLEAIQRMTLRARENLKRTEAVSRQVKDLAGKLEARSRVLARREAILAPNWDTYAWIVSTIKSFSSSHKGVSIDGYSQPEVSSEGLLPSFPYRWATFHVRGTGFYHEFGSFFADLENTFPYFRIENVVIAPITKPGAEAETLNFNFDLVTPMLAGDVK